MLGIKTTLSEIAEIVHGKFSGSEVSHELAIDCITSDDSGFPESTLYVALFYDRKRKVSYDDEAISNGAVCVLADRVAGKGPYILVKQLDAALEKLALYFRPKINIPIVAVTGSTGKTTVKDMSAGILAKAMPTAKTCDTYNSMPYIPLALLNLQPKHKAAVFELGISDFGEMRRMTEMVLPYCCVFTNIGDTHLQKLGSRRGVFEAKTEMLGGLQPEGKIIVNGDDEYLKKIKADIYYGFSESCGLRAEKIRRCKGGGTNFTAVYGGKSLRIHLNTLGRHNVLNALAAIAVGIVFGVEPKSIAEGLAEYHPEFGRFFVNKTDFITVIDDRYNSNPTSVRAALDTLAGFGGRLVCIFGDMLELGERSEEMHREVGRMAAKARSDVLVFVGEFSKYAFEEAKKLSKGKVLYFENQDELIRCFRKFIEKGDTVLVKGSHNTNMMKTVLELENL